MADKNNVQFEDQTPKPDPALRRLDVLLGTWDLTGHTLDSDEDNITGWNTFEWLPGGFLMKSTGEINFKGALSVDGKTLSGGWRPRQGEQESPENSYDAIMTRVKK
jgi:hypothetical protein